MGIAFFRFVMLTIPFFWQKYFAHDAALFDEALAPHSRHGLRAIDMPQWRRGYPTMKNSEKIPVKRWWIRSIGDFAIDGQAH
jgi:hypothetical protein